MGSLFWKSKVRTILGLFATVFIEFVFLSLNFKKYFLLTVLRKKFLDN